MATLRRAALAARPPVVTAQRSGDPLRASIDGAAPNFASGGPVRDGFHAESASRVQEVPASVGRCNRKGAPTRLRIGRRACLFVG